MRCDPGWWEGWGGEIGRVKGRRRNDERRGGGERPYLGVGIISSGGSGGPLIFRLQIIQIKPGMMLRSGWEWV